MDLSTTFLGMKLRTPLVPSASPHASSVLYLSVGTVTRRELRERAVELAVTDGRSAPDASNADWEQAKREVTREPDMAPEIQPKA